MRPKQYWYLLAIFLIAFFTCIWAAEACEKPRLVNLTSTWDAYDQATMSNAANIGCEKHFKDMPCLKVFIKTNERDYSVICGR